jgi:RES domain-containing protein
VRFWRISEFVALDGVGGTLAAGRWNSKGPPVVYMAGSSALALLEVLVRRGRGLLPPPYQLLQIDAPDELAVTHWPPEGDYHDRAATAAWGDAFLAAAATPLARVPSVIAPESWNYLLNPLHPDAPRVAVTRAGHWPWDARLFA